MLAIVPDQRSNRRLNGSSIRSQHHAGAEMQMEPLRKTFGDGEAIAYRNCPTTSPQPWWIPPEALATR